MARQRSRAWFNLTGTPRPPNGSFRKLLTKQCRVPRVLVTDKLRSYQVAHRAVTPWVEHRR